MSFGISNSEFLYGSWDASKGMLIDQLQQMQNQLNDFVGNTFNQDLTISAGAIGGKSSPGRLYVSNLGPKNSPFWATAVYTVNTDNIYITGGPITGQGLIQPTVMTEATLESAKHTLFASLTL